MRQGVKGGRDKPKRVCGTVEGERLPFSDLVEVFLSKADFTALPDPGEEKDLLRECGDNVGGLVWALVQRAVVSENGVEIELRDGTVIEE